MSLYNKIIDLQKLYAAWQQVYKNKPKEGVDSVSCEEFEKRKKQNIRELWHSLSGHTYTCMPVKLVPIYKEEKVRYIGMFTMRDKVVQNSVAKELTRIYEPCFSQCCYAYRSGRSALEASTEIRRYMAGKGQGGYALRTDIHSFFDCIRHDVLLRKLREKIAEEDVLELLKCLLKVPSLEKNGELVEKKQGLYQGSAVSPVLSNIYLEDMDHRIERETDFYLRYSDDILLFFTDQQKAEDYQKVLETYLEDLGLVLNKEKTKIISAKEGFEFLGYQFGLSGSSIPPKAKIQLAGKLEEVWLDVSCPSFQMKMKKVLEIIGGWEQYYKEERDFQSILEYAAWVYRMEQNGRLDLDEMKQKRGSLENPYKDVAVYLAGMWKANDMLSCALREYEQYYETALLDGNMTVTNENPLLGELLKLYDCYTVQESEETGMELVQIYSDLKMYQKAEFFLSGIQKRNRTSGPVRLEASVPETAVVLDSREMTRFMNLFVGREDLYALDGLVEGFQRRNEEIPEPLFSETIKSHLEQKKTISTYIQRSNGTVKYLVIDLDISKGILLLHPEDEVLEEYKKKCLETAAAILKELRHMGITGYIEYSGCRGYHVWIFFTEWIPVRYANLLADIIEQKAGTLWKGTGIQAEYFPNKTRIRNGKKGQCLKLPWGAHPKTGEMSCFLDSDFLFYEPQKKILDEIVAYTPNSIKKILSANRSEGQYGRGNVQEVDMNLEGFGTICDSVRTVLESCNLLRYICQKARVTHYLPHFERLTVLYVFGHMGEEGKEFVHKVMSFTLNYSYQTTQKFIHRCPEKPVSCLKLREQYKQISAETGCSCNFKRTKNCYPSPVLHALKHSDESKDITMPVSRTLPVNTQETLKEEINASVRAQAVAGKMMELRKQKRNIDKALKKYEQELEEIFDDCKADSMEIKMGLLVRRKSGDKTEWVIEL